MLCRWIAAAFPTPTRRQCGQKNESRSVCCAPCSNGKRCRPEREWEFRKLYRIPSTKTRILKYSLFLPPLCFPLESHTFAMGAGVPHGFIQVAFTFSQCLHLMFCSPLPRTGRCALSLAVPVHGTTFMSASLCCFLVGQVCQHLIERTPKCA